MADRCARCGRSCYRGIVRQVEPSECSLEDGASCRAFRRGVLHGVELVQQHERTLCSGDDQFAEVDWGAVRRAVVAMEGGPR